MLPISIKIQYFKKQAGLLNVPEKILKESTDWIVGKYAYLLSHEISEKIISSKKT